MNLEPLNHNSATGAVEYELKELMTGLYADYIQAEVDDINVYGAPHLGSFDLIEKIISSDGLTVLRETSEDRLRYLFNAWRNRNPQRGMHFLQTYLQIVFGNGTKAEQLWQHKEYDYPTRLRTLDEIALYGEQESDYFLTSRVRVDLDTEMVPEVLIESIKSAIAARLVLNLRIGKTTITTMGFGLTTMAVSVSRHAVTGGSYPYLCTEDWDCLATEDGEYLIYEGL